MRKQKSRSTLTSYDNLSEWQVSTTESCNYDNQAILNNVWPQFLTFDSQFSNPYKNIIQFDYNATGDPTSLNFLHQNMDESHLTTEDNYFSYDSWNTVEPYAFSEQQSADDSYLPVANDAYYLTEDTFEPKGLLQYGIPVVTDYGAIALLLRHLIRVDLTPYGSVTVYNFPAMSVTTLNAVGNKCYIKHPNGVAYQDGPVLNLMTGNNRAIKVSSKGIAFSSSLQSMAYLIDESGTKTTTTKFMDISSDLTMDVFYDGNIQTYEDLEQECYTMLSGSTYQSCPDGSELWMFGRIRIRQDRWGDVTVSQNNGRRTIVTSPTVRKVAIESPSLSINIDCYSRSYFTVRKDSCLVTSGFCGLMVQNRSQKAGLDRFGRLVLF